MNRIFMSIVSILITASLVLIPVPVAMAANTAENKIPAANVIKLSPYKDLDDKKEQVKMTNKFITKRLGLETLFSAKNMKYSGSSNLPKASFSKVKYKFSPNVKKLAPNTLSFLNKSSATSDITSKLGIKNKIIPGGTIYVDTASRKAVKISPKNGQNGVVDIDTPSIDEMFEEIEMPEEKLHLQEGNIERYAVPYEKAAVSPFLKKSIKAKGLQPLVKAKASGIISTMSGINNQNNVFTASLSKAAFGKAKSIDTIFLSKKIFGKEDKVSNMYSRTALNSTNTVAAIDDGYCLEFKFPDTALPGYSSSNGGRIDVRLGGSLKIGGLDIVGKYSAFDGYKFGITCAEEINVHLKAVSSLNEEVYIPILALDIPFEVGSVKAGLFLVAQINGEFILELAIEEGLGVEAGISGGTFFGVPTSIRPYIDADPYVNIEDNFQGSFNGSLGIGPVMQVSIMGVDLVKAELRLGGAIGCKKPGDGYIDVDVDAAVLAYISLFSKEITLMDSKWDLYTKRKKDTGPYRMTINERCAYRDLVTGKIELLTKDMDNPVVKCPNKEITILVKTGSVVKKSYTKYTDSDGNFSVDFDKSVCDMRKDDTVSIMIDDGKDNKFYSEELLTTFPFHVSISNFEYADYFEDAVSGSIGAVQIGKDPATGTPIFLNYEGSVAVTKHGSGDKTFYFKCNSMGKYQGAFAGIKPKDKFEVVIVSDGFNIKDTIMPEASCGLELDVQPVIKRDFKWPNVTNNTQHQFIFADSIDEYIFLKVVTNNTRGKKVADLPVKLSMYFGASKLGSNSMLEYYEIPNKKTMKIRNLKLFKVGEGETCDYAMYTYRFKKSTSGSTGTDTQNSASELNKNIPNSKDVRLSLEKTLLDGIKKNGSIPLFSENKDTWKKSINADYNDVGEKPVYYVKPGDYYLTTYNFIADATISYEGATLRKVQSVSHFLTGVEYEVEKTAGGTYYNK